MLSEILTAREPFGPRDSETLSRADAAEYDQLFDRNNGIYAQASTARPRTYLIGRKGAGKTAFLHGAAFRAGAPPQLVSSTGSVYADIAALAHEIPRASRPGVRRALRRHLDRVVRPRRDVPRLRLDQRRRPAERDADRVGLLHRRTARRERHGRRRPVPRRARGAGRRRRRARPRRAHRRHHPRRRHVRAGPPGPHRAARQPPGDDRDGQPGGPARPARRPGERAGRAVPRRRKARPRRLEAAVRPAGVPAVGAVGRDPPHLGQPGEGLRRQLPHDLLDGRRAAAPRRPPLPPLHAPAPPGRAREDRPRPQARRRAPAQGPAQDGDGRPRRRGGHRRLPPAAHPAAAAAPHRDPQQRVHGAGARLACRGRSPPRPCGSARRPASG